MSRRRSVKKRIIKIDYFYSSLLVSRFINYIMRNGKKSVAERIVYNSFELIKKYLNILTNRDVLLVFQTAIEHVSPLVEVRSRRIGGATYQIPITLSSARSISLGMRWLIEASKLRKSITMSQRLADEILDASNKGVSTGKSLGTGAAIKKRENIHRMAEANRAFSHYNW